MHNSYNTKQWTTTDGCRIVRLLGGRSNVFLLTKEQKNILVDTSPGRLWSKLERRLREWQVHQIDYLILTHSHFDHAGNAARVREKYQAKVIIHKEEANCL